MYKERVHFKNSFWSEQLPKLENFFDKIVLPELAYPRVKYGLSPFILLKNKVKSWSKVLQ